MKQANKVVKRGRTKSGQPGIATYATRVANPIARKRSEQQVLEEEKEFDNAPWGDTDDEYNPADGDESDERDGPVAGPSRSRSTRGNASISAPAGRTRARAKYGGELEDPIELDETDVEEIQDDEDDSMPLAVKRRKVARKDVSGPSTSMRLTRESQVAARSRATTTSTTRVEPPWEQGFGQGARGKKLIDIVGEEREMDQSRQANASPAEQCFKALYAVVKRVSRASEAINRAPVISPRRREE
jgi:hypothetical protein